MGKRSNKRRRDKGRPALTTEIAPAAGEPSKIEPIISAVSAPCKLTEEITRAICDAVGRGLHKFHIAGSVGISRQTLWEWISRGEAAEPGDEPFVTFLTRFKKAQADFCQARFGTILEHSEKTWTAAAWMLERLYPDEYSDPGKELARLHREVDELKKLVPEVQSGDSNQVILARAAAIMLANEPPRPDPPAVAGGSGTVSETPPLDAEAGAAIAGLSDGS